MAVQIHELDAYLLKYSLGQKMPLDSRQCFIGIVIGLLNQGEFFFLGLVEARLNRIRLLQPLKSQSEDLGVVLVVYGREWNSHKLAGLQPMEQSSQDSDTLLSRHVRAVLHEVVLSLLLRFQVESSQPA